MPRGSLQMSWPSRLTYVRRLGGDADRGHRVAEPELGQLPHRMREEVDADAQRPQLLCALDDGDVGASRAFEAQGGRETADSGTDDDDLHTASLLM